MKEKEKGEKEQYKLKTYSEIMLVIIPNYHIIYSTYFTGSTPKLNELQLLKLPSGTELRIIEKVAPEWDEVAVALGFDGARIKAIRMGTHH